MSFLPPRRFFFPALLLALALLPLAALVFLHRPGQNPEEAERAWMKKYMAPVFGAVDLGPPARPKIPTGGVPQLDGIGWLPRNQEADGHWDSRRFGAQRNADLEQTALAILCLLGAGHLEKGEYHPFKNEGNSRRGLAWLRAQQRPDGAFVRRGETAADGLAHAAAGWAVCSSAAQGATPETAESARRSVAYSIGAHQTRFRDRRSGFGRTPRSTTPDLLTTAFFLLHLKSARLAGIPVEEDVFQGMKAFLEEMEEKTTGDFRLARGLPATPRSTAAGCVMALYLGREPEKVRPVLDLALSEFGDPFQGGEFRDPLFIYLSTLAAVHVGGKTWEVVNRMRDPIIALQNRHADPAEGSWDPSPEWSGAGRVFADEMARLTLLVYYRYLPVYAK